MWQRLKKWGCYVIIIILLPYVVTVFINGPGVMADSHVDSTVVQVQTGDGTEEKTGIVKMPIEEYCVGVLAKEIPASYEKEALKAQAVLVRTDVYKKIKESGSDTVLDGEFWTQNKMEQAWGIQYSKYYHKLKEAWDETEGQILLYGEELAAGFPD